MLPQNDALGGTGSVPSFFQTVASLGVRYLDAKYVQPKTSQVAQPQETTIKSGMPAGDSAIPAQGYASLAGPITALATNPIIQVAVLFGVVLLVVLSAKR